MIDIGWTVGAIVWLCSYAALLCACQVVECWLIARFQQQRIRPALAVQVSNAWPTAAVFVVALLAGAAIPLAPETTIANWRVTFELFGQSGSAVLYVLVMQWIGEALLVFGDKDRPALAWRALGAMLFDALPALLIVCALLLTGRQNSLRLTAWVKAQSGWYGLGWAVWMQPLLCLLWLICARPLAATQATWAGGALTLNRALIACAFFFGGWQGPWIGRWPWLGIIYTALKGGAVIFVWTLVRAALPHPSWSARARTVWQVWMPLIVLNLVVTALIVVAI